MRHPRFLPALWLVFLLAAPIGAWLLGTRQPLLENRPKAPFPVFNRSSLRDPNTFTRIDTAVLDRLPFRGTAIKVHTRIGVDLFHDSPNPQIAIGSGGWLYFTPELGPCTGAVPIADPADAWELLARTFAAAGYRPVMFSAASKLLIHTRDAPKLDAAATSCERELELRIAQRMARTPGGVTTDAALRVLEARGESTFLRYDSHWNWRGRQAFVRRILDGIRPGLAREADPRPGNEYQHSGDLAILMGITKTERDHVLKTNTPRNPPPEGDVVLIGDSQLENALLNSSDPATPPIRDRVLPGQTSCDWTELGGGSCDEAIRVARTIVIEKVARDSLLLTSLCWDPLAIAAERLTGWRNARWEQVDDAARPAADALTVPGSGVLTVRIRPSADVSAVARLLRLTLLHTVAQADGSPIPVTMIQRPVDGSAGPCSTPAQARAGRTLLLPVPADRPAADLVLELHSAPGTRIGRPQEIALDERVHTARP